MTAKPIRPLLLFALVSLLLAACVAPFFSTSEGESTPEIAQIQGDPQRGATIFRVGVGGDAPPCSTCHSIGTDRFTPGQGPNLVGIAERAGTRIEGMTAEQYIRDSILNPKHYVVPGYLISMFTDYALYLSEQDIADLIAYLMTLSSESG